MRLLRVLVVLLILLIGGLAGYAYFGDMQADPQETRLPIQLDLGSAPAPAAVQDAAAPGTTAPAGPETPAAAATESGQDDLD